VRRWRPHAKLPDPWPECDHRFHQHTGQRTPATAIPLSANLARIEHLGRGDFVKIDCAGCHPVAQLTTATLVKLGLRPAAKVLDLEMRATVAAVEAMIYHRAGDDL